MVVRGSQGIGRSLRDPRQDGQDVLAELGRVLAHREVTQLLHDLDMYAGNLRRRAPCVFRRAGEVVLAGQQVEWADAGIDRKSVV